MAKISDYFPLSSWDDTDNNTESCILLFNGPDASTTITDETGNTTFTAFGNAQLDTANFYEGTAALLLDGTGDYVEGTYTTTYFDWWVGDWTLDCWVYATSWADWSYSSASGHIPLLVGNNDDAGLTNYWSFGPDYLGALVFYYYTGSNERITSATGVLPTSEWVHIACVHQGGRIYLLVNGEVVCQAAVQGTPQSSGATPFNIGAGNTFHLTGSVDKMRVNYGYARYSPRVGFSGPDPYAPHDYTITNPGGESGDMTGWTTSAGTGMNVMLEDVGAGLYPRTGSYLFFGDSQATAGSYQNVTAIAGPITGDDIDAGLVTVVLTYYIMSYNGSDTVRMYIDFRDQGDAQITTDYDVPEKIAGPALTWAKREIAYQVPATTRFLRLYMEGTRTNGVVMNSHIDDISMRGFVTK